MPVADPNPVDLGGWPVYATIEVHLNLRDRLRVLAGGCPAIKVRAVCDCDPGAVSVQSDVRVTSPLGLRSNLRIVCAMFSRTPPAPWAAR